MPVFAQPLLDDEFDDGIIAPIYNDICLSGAVESTGAYLYPGINLGCFAAFRFLPAAIIEVLEPGLVVPDNTIFFELRLDHIPTILPAQPVGELAGIGLNPGANTAFGMNFFVQRLPTGLEVRLFDPESGLVLQSATVSANPDTDPLITAADTIELRLDLGPNIGNELFPTAYYRLCTSATCSDGANPPFIPLSLQPGTGGADSIALADAARLTIQGLAQVGESLPFAAERLLVVPEPGGVTLLVSGLVGVSMLSSIRRRR